MTPGKKTEKTYLNNFAHALLSRKHKYSKSFLRFFPNFGDFSKFAQPSSKIEGGNVENSLFNGTKWHSPKPKIKPEISSLLVYRLHHYV